jgi:uncharacterized RDD family membrane protein YckC
MQCPACKRDVPASFNCKVCGADLMRRSAPPLDPEAQARAEAARAKRLQDQMAEASRSVNPYAAPVQADELPVRPPRPDIYVEDIIEVPLAGRGARLLAKLLDGLLAFLCMIPGFVIFIAAAVQGGTANQRLAGFSVVLMLIAIGGLAIYQIRLLAREGQTWGKKVMKVRIVLYETGEIPRLGRTLGLRIFVNGLIGMVPFVGGFYGLADPLFIFGDERRCLHDFVAGTKVVEAI